MSTHLLPALFSCRKHHGICGYVAPILDQKGVRTRGVSYLKRPCFSTKPGEKSNGCPDFGPCQAMGDLRDVVNDEMQNTMTQAPGGTELIQLTGVHRPVVNWENHGVARFRVAFQRS